MWKFGHILSCYMKFVHGKCQARLEEACSEEHEAVVHFYIDDPNKEWLYMLLVL